MKRQIFILSAVVLSLLDLSELRARTFDLRENNLLLRRIDHAAESAELSRLLQTLPHPDPDLPGAEEFYSDKIPQILRTKITDLRTFLSFGLWLNGLTSNDWPMDDGDANNRTIAPLIEGLINHAAAHNYFGLEEVDRNPLYLRVVPFYHLARKYQLIRGVVVSEETALSAISNIDDTDNERHVVRLIADLPRGNRFLVKDGGPQSVTFGRLYYTDLIPNLIARKLTSLPILSAFYRWAWSIDHWLPSTLWPSSPKDRQEQWGILMAAFHGAAVRHKLQIDSADAAVLVAPYTPKLGESAYFLATKYDGCQRGLARFAH